MESVGTEIRSYYSIKEISVVVEEEINNCKSVTDEYSQWLGAFLRDSKASKENEEWAKKMAAFQRLNPRVKAESRTEEKTKKQNASDDWIQFKEIKLNSTEKGEAEILFEVIENLNRKIELLEKVKASLVELEKAGLGNDVIYITYIHDGVPEKIVLRRKKEREFVNQFKYDGDLSTSRLIERARALIET